MQVWMNGSLVPADQARISVFDRGVLFGEGVYESVRICAGRAPFLSRHQARLGRSLAAIGLDADLAGQLPLAVAAILERDGLSEGNIYLQATRGGTVGERRHVAAGETTPTIFAFASAAPPLGEAPAAIRAVTRPDDRWHRCGIKSTNLLGNVLALAAAADDDAEEAILLRDGLVSEGAYTNVFVRLGDRLATPPIDDTPSILGGVTRDVLIDRLRADGRIRVVEEPIVESLLRDAEEILVTSSRRMVSAVTTLDGRPVGDGRVGPFARLCFDLLRRAITGTPAVPPSPVGTSA
ncbi:MAG: aminotransferase class IV [Phycisphaerales bacterium]